MNLKSLTSIFAFFACLLGHAQENRIIYVDFEPDSCMYVPSSTCDFWIDLNNDGDADIHMNRYWTSIAMFFDIHSLKDNLSLCSAEENDTLMQIQNWRDKLSFAERHECWGYRFEDEGNYYYGWFRTYTVKQGDDKRWCFDKYAYCTIPDYPLRWGQTELNTSVDENSEGVFAVYPNPAKQSVTLIGQQIAEARLYSVTGQLVATKQGEGTESLTMDISGLPSGLYFVAVISRDGRKCVKKVVKE